MSDYKNERDLLIKAEEIFIREPKLIELPSSGKAIFVGDTHGDLDATKKIIAKYGKEGNKIVFLGDYVDRGPYSKENLYLLLSSKLSYPDEIFLLMGNHEGFTIKEFSPANFWLNLSGEERNLYGSILSKLPLAISTKNGVIALHGALPDLAHIKEVDQITVGDESWDQITWGDFYDGAGERLGGHFGRPRFGRDYFNRIMSAFNRNVLIRSHQPDAKPIVYDGRCLTIFTSHAYLSVRTVAVVDLAKKEIKDTNDLTIEEV
jgi:predicted phosphodiesterase